MSLEYEKVRVRPPVVTLLLISANLFAAFSLLLSPDLGLDWGFRVQAPRIQTALTSLFLHANVLHLLGNMVFLAAVGAAVEIATGSIRFILVYFLGGFLGLLLHWLAVHQVPVAVPLIGASGCIASCAAYYGFRYRQMKVPILPNKAVPVIAIVFVWLFLQVLGGFVQIGDDSGVSYWSHFGGVLAGVLLSLVFVAPDPGQLKIRHEALRKMNEQSPAAVATAAKRLLNAHPYDPQALRELIASSAKMGERDEEVRALFRLFDIAPEDERKEIVRRLVHLQAQDGFTSKQLIQLSDRFALEENDVSLHLLTEALRQAVERQRPEILVQMIGLMKDRDVSKAEPWIHELRLNYPLHPATELARKRGWM